MKAILHHFAYNIRPESLETVIEILELLGCNVSFREENARWCMIGQSTIPINIQLIEVKNDPIAIKDKINTHIAFLSDTPEEDIEKIKKYAAKRGIVFRHGSWNEKEHWFDLPEIFVNFVIEIMHTSVAD